MVFVAKKMKLKLNGNDDKHTVQRVEWNQKVVFIFEENGIKCEWKLTLMNKFLQAICQSI